MRRHCIILLLLLTAAMPALAQWRPAGDKIMTCWADSVSPASPLPDYPRPQMVRAEWASLNGLWDYAITPRGVRPDKAEGRILVPFAVESGLSGVGRTVGKDSCLWYRRTFTVPGAWRGRGVLLHFGAVDYEAAVFLNGVKIGSHRGGYGAFTVDMTPYLADGEQTLAVRVWDPTTDGTQAVGKQRTRPEGIWYTPVTGIWQTVWMEPVAEGHIERVLPVADIDHASLSVRADVAGARAGDVVGVTLTYGGRTVAEGRAAAGQAVEVAVPEPRLWSPESPELYGLKVRLLSGGRAVDSVESYAAMRKIALGRDAAGVVRLMLNNRPYFQYGPLDQGYWPDGLYTAPTDAALAYDIRVTKDYGFNMIRKHMKVEPDRWYAWCDRLGVLVWQDMPSGDYAHQPDWQQHQYYRPVGRTETRSEASKEGFRGEWAEIIGQLAFHPCIVVWTPFNEAWGQFDTPEIVALTKRLDPTRLVNTASGGNHFATGDLLDLHNYPEPRMYMYDYDRATVMGEYGGLGLPLKGHLWNDDGNWGYVKYKTRKEVTDRYVELAGELEPMVGQGFAAAVYTQTTDVEGEVNGLMTYDRKVLKLDPARVRQANGRVIGLVK